MSRVRRWWRRLWRRNEFREGDVVLARGPWYPSGLNMVARVAEVRDTHVLVKFAPEGAVHPRHPSEVTHYQTNGNKEVRS